MKLVSRSLAACALLALSAGAANAQSRSWTVCGGNAFNTCASVYLQVSGQNVTVNVWNLSGFFGTYAGTVFTAVGFEGIGNVSVASSPTPTMTGPVRGTNTPATWGVRDDKTVGGGVNLDLAGLSGGSNTSVNNSISSACSAPGLLPTGKNQLWQNPCTMPTSPVGGAGWVTMTFSVTGTWDVANTFLLVKGQNGPNGASTECMTGGSQQNCFEQNVVPEPITMVLLGSGLAGMGGVNFLRRRRKNGSEEV